MDEQQAPATTPPGWYPDPKLAGTQRYWDGQRWTDNVAPLVMAPPRPASSDSNLETIGWLTAFLFPIVGVVVGIILATRSNSKGVPILLVSIAVMAVVYAMLSNQATGGYY